MYMYVYTRSFVGNSLFNHNNINYNLMIRAGCRKINFLRAHSFTFINLKSQFSKTVVRGKFLDSKISRDSSRLESWKNRYFE